MPYISESGSGIDQCHLLVWERPVPLIELLHGVFEDVEIALCLSRLRLEHQRVELHRPHGRLEYAVGGDEIGRCGPGEIVDVFAMEAERLGAVGVGLLTGGHAARADDIALGTFSFTSKVPKSAKNSVVEWY